jgi:hypothetical protein
MIREPTVGMRVKITDSSEGRFLETGKIIQIDGDSLPIGVEFPCETILFYEENSVTEIKESDMKKGDLVKVDEADKMICVSDYEDEEKRGWIRTKFDYEIVQLIHSEHKGFHDVYIKSGHDGRIYLHSRKYLIPAKVKEVTAEQMMRDLKEKYGCEVKVTE